MALSQYELKWKKIDLTDIIARGDMLNHAIFSLEELSNGFQKLQLKGLIKVKEDQIALSDLAFEIMKKVIKICLENVPLNLISSCEFLTESNLSRAYNIYSK